MLSIQRKVVEEKPSSSAPVFFRLPKVIIVDSSKKRPSLPQSGGGTKKRKEDTLPGLFPGFQAASSLFRQQSQPPLLVVEPPVRTSVAAIEASYSAPMAEIVQAAAAAPIARQEMIREQSSGIVIPDSGEVLSVASEKSSSSASLVASPQSSAVEIKPIIIRHDVRPAGKTHFSDQKYSHSYGISRWLDGGLSGKRVFSFDNAEIRGESIERKLNLMNVSFKGVVLTGKTFVNVDLRGAVIDCRYLQGTVFSPGSVLIDSTTMLIAPEKLSDKQRLGLGLMVKKQAHKEQRPITAFFAVKASVPPMQLIQDLENHEPVNGGFSRPS